MERNDGRKRGEPSFRQEVNRNKMLAKFVDIQYERNDVVRRH